jgi:uncharacterized membrane protein YgcG
MVKMIDTMTNEDKYVYIYSELYGDMSHLSVYELSQKFINLYDILIQDRNKEMLDLMDRTLPEKMKAVLDVFVLAFGGNRQPLFLNRGVGESFNLNSDQLGGAASLSTTDIVSSKDDSLSDEQMMELSTKIFGSNSIYGAIVTASGKMSDEQRIILFKMMELDNIRKKESIRFKINVAKYMFAAVVGGCVAHIYFKNTKALGVAAVSTAATGEYLTYKVGRATYRAGVDLKNWALGRELTEQDIQNRNNANEGNDGRLYAQGELTDQWYNEQYIQHIIIGAGAGITFVAAGEKIGKIFQSTFMGVTKILRKHGFGFGINFMGLGFNINIGGGDKSQSKNKKKSKTKTKTKKKKSSSVNSSASISSSSSSSSSVSSSSSSSSSSSKSESGGGGGIKKKDEK